RRAAPGRARPRPPRGEGDDPEPRPRAAHGAAEPLPRAGRRHLGRGGMTAPARTGAGSLPEPAAKIVVITAGTTEPSSTRLLADRLAQKSVDMLAELGAPATVNIIELAPLAVDIARGMVAG